MKEENNILTYSNRKWILWVILVVGGFFFLSIRYASVNGSFTTVDMIILLFWIGLLLMPFFQEIDFYGLKLKKEIDKLKLDIDRQFVDLSRQFVYIRSEINNSNDIRPQFTYNLTNQLSDDQLIKREEFYRQILEKTVKSEGIKKPTSESELIKIPDDVQYLFSVRYQIEKELKRITNEIYPTSNEISYKNNRRPNPTYKMVDYLANQGYIDPNVANIIMQLNGITSRAIHGEEISKGQFNFVHGTAPDLIAILKGITG